MSTSILYLAIVAIWAGFLVPAWIRRPHGSRSGANAITEDDHNFGDMADEAAAAGARAAARVGSAAAHRTDTESDADAGMDTGARVGVNRRGAYSWPENNRGSDPAAGEGWYDEPSVATSMTGLPQSREQMLRARRTMLATLIVLTLITGASVAVGLVKWWIILPPLVVLVLYVMLLREIAIADADLARKRYVWEAHAAAAEADRRREPDRRAASGSSPEPSAEVIDISDRVSDELYDQYADAAVRAVGD